MIDRLGSELSEINVKCEEENKKRTKIVEDLNLVSPFLKLPGDIDQLVHYRFVQVRFGRIAREYYEKFKAYVYDSLDTWFYPCHEDEYVWGVYFVPWTRMEEVDAVFSSLHFERIYIKKDYQNHSKILYQLQALLQVLNLYISSLQLGLICVMLYVLQFLHHNLLQKLLRHFLNTS